MKREWKDAFPPVDESFERSMDCAFEVIRKEKNMRNRTAIHHTILIAAVLVAMTTAIGFATGLFQSAFSRMKTEGFAGTPTTDYDALDNLADADVSRQTIVFSGDASVEIALERSYYNGEQLALGWTYRGPDEVVFYEKGDERFAEVHPTEQEVVEDGQTYLQDEGIDVEQHFVPEIVDELYNRVAGNQWAGLFWYDVWMGDGVWLPGVESHKTFWDGTTIDEENTYLYLSEGRDWNRIGAGQRYCEFETPLPEAARNQPSLRVMCRVYMRPTWLCYEGEMGKVKSFIGYGETEAKEVYFDIPLTGKYEEETYQAEVSFPNHTASVSIKKTPIYVQIEVSSHIPEAWKQAWAKHEGYYVPPLNLDEDCAFEYEVWVERNGQVECVMDMLEDINGIETFTGQFVIPDEASAIILRPIYANTGVHESEEVKIII